MGDGETGFDDLFDKPTFAASRRLDTRAKKRPDNWPASSSEMQQGHCEYPDQGMLSALEDGDFTYKKQKDLSGPVRAATRKPHDALRREARTQMVGRSWSWNDSAAR